MNYKLKNKYDVFTKVKNVIESCEIIEHLKVATAMLDNFQLYYKENDNFLLKILNEARRTKLSELAEKSITNTKSK